MCGFASIIALHGGKVNVSHLKNMSRVIRHRGPNSDGIYIDDSVGLAFRRLSIQDLSKAGSQPMKSSDNRYVVVFNGEIYNYIELREELIKIGFQFHSGSDTEVLLNAFIAWGWDCLQKLNGMWAFLIYDTKLQKIYGSRDRFGVKPLYIYRSERNILFGSEIKAIRASQLCKTDVNWVAASQFLIEERLDETEKTFFKGIESIPPGSFIEVDLKGNVEVKKFWKLDELEGTQCSDPVETYRELFEDAVRLRLRADVPQGVFLSGGLDSTSIICEVARLKNDVGGNEPIKAFSFIHSEFDESSYISETVEDTNCQLNRVTTDATQLWGSLESALWHHDEPLHSLTALIGFNLAKLAASHGTTVILNGQGADETCAGYPSYFRNYWYTLMRSGNFLKAWQQIGGYANTFEESQFGLFSQTFKALIQSQFSRSDFYRKISGVRHQKMIRNHRWFTSDFVDHLPCEDEGRHRLDLESNLIAATEISPLPLYLRVEDRNSMAHGIEVRLPFLDYRLVSFLFSQVSSEMKMNGCWNKYLMREAMKGKIPELVRKRKDKMGFPVPAKTWVSENLHEYFREILTDSAACERGIYNIDVMLGDLDRHRKGEIDISAELFDVVQFEMWMKGVFEAPEYAPL